MKSRVFCNIAGATIVATAKPVGRIRKQDLETANVWFRIIREADEQDLEWTIPFATYADARGALDHISQPLLEQVVTNAIEFNELCPF